MLDAVRDVFAISLNMRSAGSQDLSSLSGLSESVLTRQGCTETHILQGQFSLMLADARTRDWVVGILSIEGGLGKKVYICIYRFKKEKTAH